MTFAPTESKGQPINSLANSVLFKKPLFASIRFEISNHLLTATSNVGLLNYKQVLLTKFRDSQKSFCETVLISRQ